jgi:hypothetical protein
MLPLQTNSSAFALCSEVEKLCGDDAAYTKELSDSIELLIAANISLNSSECSFMRMLWIKFINKLIHHQRLKSYSYVNEDLYIDLLPSSIFSNSCEQDPVSCVASDSITTTQLMLHKGDFIISPLGRKMSPIIHRRSRLIKTKDLLFADYVRKVKSWSNSAVEQVKVIKLNSTKPVHHYTIYAVSHGDAMTCAYRDNEDQSGKAYMLTGNVSDALNLPKNGSFLETALLKPIVPALKAISKSNAFTCIEADCFIADDIIIIDKIFNVSLK